MKKKSFALAAVVVSCATSFAFVAPQTQWTQGQWQFDVGAWNPKAVTGRKPVTSRQSA